MPTGETDVLESRLRAAAAWIEERRVLRSAATATLLVTVLPGVVYLLARTLWVPDWREIVTWSALLLGSAAFLWKIVREHDDELDRPRDMQRAMVWGCLGVFSVFGHVALTFQMSVKLHAIAPREPVVAASPDSVPVPPPRPKRLLLVPGSVPEIDAWIEDERRLRPGFTKRMLAIENPSQYADIVERDAPLRQAALHALFGGILIWAAICFAIALSNVKDVADEDLLGGLLAWISLSGRPDKPSVSQPETREPIKTQRPHAPPAAKPAPRPGKKRAKPTPNSKAMKKMRRRHRRRGKI